MSEEYIIMGETQFWKHFVPNGILIKFGLRKAHRKGQCNKLSDWQRKRNVIVQFVPKKKIDQMVEGFIKELLHM